MYLVCGFWVVYEIHNSVATSSITVAKSSSLIIFFFYGGPESVCMSSDFFFKNSLLTALGHCCCARAFSSCGEQGLLSSCGTQDPERAGFGSCGLWAPEYRLSSYCTWA